MQNCYDCQKTCGYTPSYNSYKRSTPKYMPAPVSYVSNYKVNAGGNYNFKNQNKVGG